MNKLIWHKWAISHANKICLKDDAKSYSWYELKIRVDDIAIQLQNFFSKTGFTNNILAVITNNHLDSVLLYLASIQSGIICAPIAPDNIKTIISKFKILKSKVFYPNPAAISAKEIKVLINKGYQRLDINKNVQDHLIKAKKSIKPTNDIASIIFTSGSGGIPKAIAHSYQNHFYSAKGLLEKIAFNKKDIWALSLPLHHISGMAIIWRWLYRGAVLLIPKKWQNLEHATHASLVPTQLQKLLADNVSINLKTVLLGGGYVDLKLAHECARRKINTWVSYGLTEATSTVCLEKININHTNNFSGEILNYRKIKIIERKIIISGKVLASGQIFNGKLVEFDPQQGLFTGDYGEYDKNNKSSNLPTRIKITGRADNQFISGGKNIHCEEIENALLTSPKINYAIVVPVADKVFGARSVAIIDSKTNLNKMNFKKILLQLPKYKHPIEYLKLPSEYNKLDLTTGLKQSRKKIANWLYANSEYRSIQYNY